MVVVVQLVGGMKDSHNRKDVGAIQLGNLSQRNIAYHDVGDGTSCLVDVVGSDLRIATRQSAKLG